MLLINLLCRGLRSQSCCVFDHSVGTSDDCKGSSDVGGSAHMLVTSHDADEWEPRRWVTSLDIPLIFFLWCTECLPRAALILFLSIEQRS